MEDAEHALLRPVDDLDDAAGVEDAVVFLDFLDAQQYAVAEPGGFAGAHLARDVDADFRRRAVGFLVPFVGGRDQVAVAVARGDVGKHGGGQRSGVMEFLALLLDGAFVAEFAQHALEFGSHGILEAEGAGDFAGPDFAGLFADEGEEFGLGGEGGCLFSRFVQ